MFVACLCCGSFVSSCVVRYLRFVVCFFCWLSFVVCGSLLLVCCLIVACLLFGCCLFDVCGVLFVVA